MSLKSIIIAIIIILVIIFVVWYFYYNSNQTSQSFQTQKNINPQSSQGNIDTTAGILNDLNQIPNDSSANGEMNSLNQNIQSF